MSGSRDREESGNCAEFDDHAYRVAHLAAVLMSQRLRVGKNMNSPLISDLSDPRWDREFDGASKRAQMLLSQSSERNYDVHAYQVFKEGASMSQEQIAAEFKRIGWSNLRSKEPVRKLLDGIESQMRHLFQGVEDSLSRVRDARTEEAYKIVHKTLTAIARLPIVQEVYPKFTEKAERLVEEIDREWADPSGGRLQVKATWYESFNDWCFLSEERGERKIRKYRPHEIFRFCGAMRWHDDVLRLTLSALSVKFHPYPEKPLNPVSFEIFEASHPRARAYVLDGGRELANEP